MKFTLIVLILSLFIVSKLIEAGGGSAENKQRRDTCDDLVKREDSSKESSELQSNTESTVQPTTDLTDFMNATYSAFINASYNQITPGNCIFTRAMWNISLTLSYEYQIILQQWIMEIQTTFLLDESLTEDELVVKIAYSLKSFSKMYSEIWKLINYVKIDNWGYCNDFLSVAIEIQLEKTTNIIELDSNGDCKLFDAIRNKTNGNAAAQTEAEDLIAQLTIIFQNSGWSYEQKMAACYNTFSLYYESSSSLKDALKDCEIDGYGSLESFLDVSLTFERSTTLSTVISGNSSDCVLLNNLVNCYMNTSLTISVRNQIKQLHDTLAAFFSNTTSLALRLEYTSETLYSFFELVGFNVQLLEEIQLGSWGTIDDLEFVSSICTNYGCGDVDAGPGSDATTVAPSTKKSADCSTINNLVTLQTNQTYILINTIQEQYNTWNFTLKTGFNSYFNQLKSWCSNTTMTNTQKVQACKTTLLSYNKNNVYAQSVVFNITITSWSGTIGQFVACN